MIPTLDGHSDTYSMHNLLFCTRSRNRALAFRVNHLRHCSRAHKKRQFVFTTKNGRPCVYISNILQDPGSEPYAIKGGSVCLEGMQICRSAGIECPCLFCGCLGCNSLEIMRANQRLQWRLFARPEDLLRCTRWWPAPFFIDGRLVQHALKLVWGQSGPQYTWAMDF